MGGWALSVLFPRLGVGPLVSSWEANAVKKRERKVLNLRWHLLSAMQGSALVAEYLPSWGQESDLGWWQWDQRSRERCWSLFSGSWCSCQREKGIGIINSTSREHSGSHFIFHPFISQSLIRFLPSSHWNACSCGHFAVGHSATVIFPRPSSPLRVELLGYSHGLLGVDPQFLGHLLLQFLHTAEKRPSHFQLSQQNEGFHQDIVLLVVSCESVRISTLSHFLHPISLLPSLPLYSPSLPLLLPHLLLPPSLSLPPSFPIPPPPPSPPPSLDTCFTSSYTQQRRDHHTLNRVSKTKASMETNLVVRVFY